MLFITQNPRLINERGFKSREGYNGAGMVPANDEHFQNSASIYVTFSVVLNWCDLLTYWMVFHFESSSCQIPIRLKMKQDLNAWWDMAGRNWITTIFSHHEWCTWIPIINGQGIIAEKTYKLFVFLIWQLQRNGTYPQLNSGSTSNDRKLISIVCPICTWISQVKSRLLS